MPMVTYGGFVNPASDRALLFCDTEQREKRTPWTPFSFAKTVLLDIRLIVIPCHVCWNPTVSSALTHSRGCFTVFASPFLASSMFICSY